MATCSKCLKREAFEWYEAQAKAAVPGTTKDDYEKRFEIICEKMLAHANKRRLGTNVSNRKDENAIDLDAVQNEQAEDQGPTDPEEAYYE